MKPEVLTVRDVCQWLRVHHATVYRMLRKGQLTGFKIGSDWRFLSDEVAKLMDNCVTQAGEKANANPR